MSNAQSLFTTTFGRPPDVAARAPGRVEFIGNHTDYNRGLVLGAAVDRYITVALAARPGDRIRALSDGHGEAIEFVPGEIPAGTWAAYPAGVVAVLAERAAIPGCDLVFHSDLPVGAGLSSSAAIETATAAAIDRWLGIGLTPVDLARAARRAENEYVGVPCGILDQAVVTFGRQDHLVRVDATAERFEPIPIPGETRLWIFDSGVRHRLTDGHYAERHRECREAFDVLHPLQPEASGLALIEPDLVEASRALLPGPLYHRARHITREHRRVEAVVGHLAHGRLREAGTALFESHRSSRDDFGNSVSELDLLVDRLSQEPSVLGARLTGGGFGGAVLAWTEPSFGVREADAVCRVFQSRFGRRPSVLSCRASDGVRVEPVEA